MTDDDSEQAIGGCAICGARHAPGRLWVVENTDGAFVASFSTHLLAHYFVEEGSGCYRHRDAPSSAEVAATLSALADELDARHLRGAVQASDDFAERLTAGMRAAVVALAAHRLT